MGPFDKMFDYNNDGKLDTWEKAAELSFLDHISVVDGIEDDEFCDEEEDDAGYEE